MKIKILAIPRHYYRPPWPETGTVLEVPDRLGEYMIKRGQAEAAKVEKPPAPEAAVVAPTERAVKPKPHGRKG